MKHAPNFMFKKSMPNILEHNKCTNTTWKHKRKKIIAKKPFHPNIYFLKQNFNLVNLKSKSLMVLGFLISMEFYK